MAKSKVYFSKEITSDTMIRMYQALGVELPGKVAVKLHSGEVGNQNFIRPAFLKPVIDHVHGTIVECNTAYSGKRNTTEAHWETMKLHGWTDIAEVDIMDEEKDLELPIKDGKQIQKNYVGDHLSRYDSMLVLSHFKGHAMGGFGGALKNVAIGVASAFGKAYIHGNGTPCKTLDDMFAADHDSFLESMADADSAVIDYLGSRNMLYINVANRLSVDCDCDANPHEPEMADIGIFASLDPVAIDQACVDAVYASPDPGKAALIERMESLNGIHTVEAAAELGLGVREYELVELDG